MNPFVKMEKARVENELPLLKEFAWDFDKDRFIYKTDGTIRTVKENEALKVWIYKALKTASITSNPRTAWSSRSISAHIPITRGRRHRSSSG